MKFSVNRFSLSKEIGLCFIWLLLIFSCTEETAHTDYKESLFVLKTKAKTNIDFVNALPESPYMNYFVYEYFYNGGGVAIGDVNGDNLDDIYFTANLKDNRLFLNMGNLEFRDITKQANVSGKKGWSTGVTMVDVNQDGLLDIYVCRSGRFADADKRRNELFINQGNNTDGVPIFKEAAAQFGLDSPTFTTQASFFDYDKDGDLDVFLANHNIEISSVADIDYINNMRQTESLLGGNKLLKNDGGVYKDITTKTGIHSHMINYTLGVSVSDVNDDNWPDIYVACDYSEPDHLYINNKDGTFKDVNHESFRHIPNFSMGTDIGDINNDGLQDIINLDMSATDNYSTKTSMSGMDVTLFNNYVKGGLHHQYMYNTLQLNKGKNDKGVPVFSDIAQIAGVSSTDWSWAPLLADFDNDGLKDLYVTNGIKRDFRNNDFAKFLQKATKKVVEERKNPLKLYGQWTKMAPTRGKANFVYKNKGNLQFSDAVVEWGLGNQLSYSNGAAYGDLDNDGDLDLIVNNTDSLAFVYENQSNKFDNKHFLNVKLKGSSKNRSGIGTKVIIHNNDNTYIREQFPVRGFQSSVSRTLHFGLGNLSKVQKIMVVWPDGKQQELHNVKTNQLLLLDYKNAKKKSNQSQEKKATYFKDITLLTGVDYTHRENDFNDFDRESLLPHKMSQMGPAMSVGDLDNDGLDDIFIGGAMGQSGIFYIQDTNGKFIKKFSAALQKDKNHEDVGSILFDADADGDLDLYVVSGGNEKGSGDSYYLDRFYENDKGNFIKNNTAIPKLPFSGSCIISSDYDNDGDQDLFIGGRQIPGKYPNPESSYLLRNDSSNKKIKFTDVTAQVAPTLNKIGMVTDALFTDVDNDDDNDLVIVGEWMPINILENRGNSFKNITQDISLLKDIGWWNTIKAHDFDSDGDMDFVAGNLGLNYKYKASKGAPFEIFANDFDQTGTLDIVLSFHEKGTLYPLRGRQCSSEQMPFIKERFPNYEAFGKATIIDVYGENNLNKATHYAATNFATVYIENKGDKGFSVRSLDNLAQISSVNSIEVLDINKDGNTDLVLSGNLLGSEVETPKNDAAYGLCLLGDGKGDFKPLMPNESGLLINGEVRNSEIIEIKEIGRSILFAKNNGNLDIIKIN